MKTELELSILGLHIFSIDEKRYDFDSLLYQHIQHIVDTKDEMSRQALIFLGWTPPKKEKTYEELKASGILKERKYISKSSEV